ncbi:MAG: S16 family serine protease, partial [Candidatus Syntropharchaeales archaeon]
QLSFYRDEIAELKSKISANNVTGEVGTARLDAPAVLRRVEYSGEFPFMTQQIIEEGTMMEVTVEIKPGKGRVLVETEPLMGVVFQDAANNAVAAAENYLGCDLSGSDVIFSVEAEAEVPEVDGPSAGALMTTLVVAAVENITLPEDITMTGTISPDGHVGEIGGVIEKAKASKAAGKRILMLPEENAHIVRYEAVKKQYGGLTVITQKPVIIDTEEYIEENIGIDVVYVDSLKEIFDVING